jgi:hypothetical protein
LAEITDFTFGKKKTQAYMLCGWRTVSDIPLTCVRTLYCSDQNFDVLIELAHGSAPMAGNMSRFSVEHSSQRSLIKIRDVADFEIIEGRRIRVWPASVATRKDIEIFLLGPAWATLCHQRGLLPLHASSILTRGGMVAFAGHSGSGKSTTAAMLNVSGYQLVADDILPIGFIDGSIPGAWPYLRRLKLHQSPIVKFGLTPTELVSSSLDNEKYFVQPESVARDAWNRLTRLYLLVNSPSAESVCIDRMTSLEAIRILADQTYHFDYVLNSGRFREHLDLCVLLASKIAIYRLLRPSSSEVTAEFETLLRAHIEDAEIDNRGIVHEVSSSA